VVGNGVNILLIAVILVEGHKSRMLVVSVHQTQRGEELSKEVGLLVADVQCMYVLSLLPQQFAFILQHHLVLLHVFYFLCLLTHLFELIDVFLYIVSNLI